MTNAHKLINGNQSKVIQNMFISIYIVSCIFQVQGLLQQMQDKFQAASDQIISRNILFMILILWKSNNE